MRLNWPQTAMNLAFDIAKYRSEDPYVKVGACIIKKNKDIVLGYNGAPANMQLDWSNRDERRKWVFHAEANALTRILPGEAILLAVTHIPCIDCLKDIKMKAIDTVYYSIRSEQYNPQMVEEIASIYKINLIKLDYVNIE